MTVAGMVARGIGGVLVVGCALLAGSAAGVARGKPAESVQNTWADFDRQHSDASYDQATVRFTGRLAEPVLAKTGALSSGTAVLVALRAADVAGCEDLGRQLRDLYRAVPEGEGWGMAILVDPAGEAELRAFLAREHIPSIPVITADPAALLAGGTKVATPAALVVDRDGRVRAGVSHPERFKNVRGRSFAQELPLNDTGSI